MAAAAGGLAARRCAASGEADKTADKMSRAGRVAAETAHSGGSSSTASALCKKPAESLSLVISGTAIEPEDAASGVLACATIP